MDELSRVNNDMRNLLHRTMQDIIDGVVITFSNITAANALEAKLRKKNARLKSQ